MPHRILIADDYAPILFSVRRYFSAHGFDVDCARDRELAEALIGRYRYAAVIVDLRLTATDENEGLTLIRAVRERDASTPVLLLTAYATEAIEDEAARAGASAVVHKPVALGDLLALITRVIERGERETSDVA